MSQSKARGFTLMELVVTLALLGLMSMMAAPLAEVTVQRHKEQALRDALREIRTAIDRYKLAADQGLIVRQVGDSGYPPTLEVLATGVANQKSASSSDLTKKDMLIFLRRVPRDPFNADLTMPAAASWKLRSSTSPADAPEPGKDVFDVVSTATGNGLNGVPYSEW